MKPLISIIIPSFNSEHYLQETLESVLKQTYTSWECLIIDDDSVDNTIKISDIYCEKDDRFSFYSRPLNKLKGPSSCRNFGLEKAKGEFILFLDSDDLLAIYCLEERIIAFKNYKECDFLVFQMERFVNSPQIQIKIPLEEVDIKHSMSSFLTLNSIWQVTSPIYKKDFLIKTKGFNEDLLNFEDLELAVRVIYKSSDFKLFNNVDSFYRNDENYRAKYKSKKVMHKSVNAFFIFINSIHKEVILKLKDKQLETTYKQDIVLAYKKIFLTYIKENVNEFRFENKKMITFLNRNNYLSNKQRFIFYFTQNILFKLYRIKGLGLYRFMKYLYQ